MDCKFILQSEEVIRGIAYDIWEKEGRPDGKALEHWLRAKKTICLSTLSLCGGLKEYAG